MFIIYLQTLSDKSNEFIEAAKARVVQGAGTFPPGIEEQFKLLIERLEHGSPIAEIATFNGLGSNPPVKGKKYASFAYGTSHPFSRGTIHSTSNDPYKFPELDPQVFSEEIDLDMFVEMTKFMRTMADVAPLKDMIVKEHNPGAEVQTDEQIKEWLKQTISTRGVRCTFNAPLRHDRSCSMLPEASGGVVDNELRVYGTKNLRVVDLSIVPLHFAAHAMSTVYALAEMAADIIKGKFPFPEKK
ncbi:GMC oxidoreductase-domain-containing protein [Amylocystis lapponica]|nr:GMC oxidoreductase-domain-containing protein [Amylocystis lapponica]